MDLFHFFLIPALFSPGHTSALIGYHYGNQQNAFWRCLHYSGKSLLYSPSTRFTKRSSGFTETILKPTDGPSLPERYGVGLVRHLHRVLPSDNLN